MPKKATRRFSPNLERISKKRWEVREADGVYAARLMTYARAYLAAFQVLTVGRDVSGEFRPAYMLVAHAAELALKAFYLAAGGKQPKLGTGNLNHDLRKVLTVAKRRGIKLSDDTCMVLRNLGLMNLEFEFRYPGRHKLEVHPPSQCLMAVEEVFAVVAPCVETAAIEGSLLMAAATRKIRGHKYFIAKTVKDRRKRRQVRKKA